jgi:hypothetical protein
MGKSSIVTPGSAEKDRNADALVFAQLPAWGTYREFLLFYFLCDETS